MSKFFTLSHGAWVLTVVTLLLSDGCVRIRREVVRADDRYPEGRIPHNQTSREALDVLEKEPAALGTGVFTVAAPDAGPLAVRVILVPDLDYEECVRSGSLARTVKFIPYELFSRDKVLGTPSEPLGAAGEALMMGDCGQPCCGTDPGAVRCPYFCPCDDCICRPGPNDPSPEIRTRRGAEPD